MVDIATANVPSNFLPGEWLITELPDASLNKDKVAIVIDGPGFTVRMSDGAAWKALGKRTETYNGTTDASGNYSITYATGFAAVPHVNPVCYPAADSVTRVRVIVSSMTGFTVKTEKNATVNLLGIDILGIGTANVISVPVRVLVIES